MQLTPAFLRTTYWINDYLKGNPILSHYKDLGFIQENREEGEKKRQYYLRRLLEYASQKSPFYKDYSPKRFEDFPIVNKIFLRKHYDQIRISPDKIPGQKGKLLIQTTSGSTGTPFAIPQDTIKRHRRIAELKYFGKISGFKSHEKLIHLRTWDKWQHKTRLQSFRENIIPFDIAHLDQGKLQELASLINTQHVLAIRGYASSIDLLARYAQEKKLKFPSLKLAIAGSELLQDSTRQLVKEHLNCNIISQYANEENGILAQERSTGGAGGLFYLNHASYWFEILKLEKDELAEEGELGRIVLTDLFNFAFPMIRYDTGDTGVLQKGDTDSHGYPILSELSGRRVDLVYSTNGDIIHPIAISRLLKHYPEIQQWQFIQNNQADYLLKMIIKDDDSMWNDIHQELYKLLGDDAKITLQLTNNIPVLSSGKRKPVINNWKV